MIRKTNDLGFKCKKCGECCRHINLVADLNNYDRGDGTCIYLKNSTCSIYDSRPLICNVDLMYETYFSNVMTKEEYYTQNYRGCTELQSMKKKGAVALISVAAFPYAQPQGIHLEMLVFVYGVIF